jgi:hypothetical protein
VRHRKLSHRLAGLAVLPAAFLLASCIHTFWKTVAVRVTAPDTGTVAIHTPLKVHLANGRTAVFRQGASIDRTAISGAGVSYGLTEAPDATVVARVPLDSVVGVETFEGKMLTGPTVAVSLAATAVTAAATVLLLKALFGSCPTVYADTGTGPVLEAEGFSYSIAPLLEQRDMDPLVARPDADGIIRLELRNEALETHYINNIELTAVRHARGTRVMPDQSNHPVIVSEIRPVDAARDRAGRDLRPTLAAADGALFSSDSGTIDAARAGDLDDWIDLDARDLPPGDSVAVVLRLRNSLLSTVLLYDGMLSGRDAPEWLDAKLSHIATAVDLSTWYTRTMGLRASIDGVPSAPSTSWNARLGDVGPLAFRDVALVLPRPKRDARAVNIRLRFVTDDWRIDYAAIGAKIERPSTKTIALHRAMVTRAGDGAAVDDTAAVAALREPDGRYLQTTPGQRMTLEFDAGKQPARTDSATTYLITWQGWYREWIRGQWLAEPKRSAAWTPGDSAVVVALKRWRADQPQMEHAFYSSRVPVR